MAKSRRLQVLVEDEQWARLEAEAAERGVSVGHLVRAAIDAVLPGGREDRRAAATAVLQAQPMPVPDPAALQDELEVLRGRRG